MPTPITTTPDPTEGQPAAATGPATEPGKEYAAPATQADLDAIIGARVERERAKYTDYDQIKTRLAELEDAGKSEQDKLTDRLTSAEAEAASVPAKTAEALRDALVTLGVVAEDRKVLLTATDTDGLLAQVKAIQALAPEPKKPATAPLQGHTTTATGGTEATRSWLRSLTDRD